jgi:hypothetical protein
MYNIKQVRSTTSTVVLNGISMKFFIHGMFLNGVDRITTTFNNRFGSIHIQVG